MLHGRSAALALFVAAALAAPAAHAALDYQERIETFDIGTPDSNRASLWQGLRRVNPEANGLHGIGSTQAQTNWTRTLERNGGLCRIKTINVTTAVTIKVPTWNGRKRAEPVEQKYWDCVGRSVLTHEKQHAQLWRTAGQRLDEELSGITDWMSCERLEDTLKQTAQRLQDEARLRQSELDDDERRRPRYAGCKAELNQPVATKDAKDSAVTDEGGGKATAAAPAEVSSEPAQSEPTQPVRSRFRTASGGIAFVANSTLWLLLWIGGLLVGGMACFIIFMKARMRGLKDEDAIEDYKERSALLRLARHVDDSAGGFVKRSSLPDRVGVRRKRMKRARDERRPQAADGWQR